MGRHDEEEDGEIQRTPSDHYQNENSSSSMPDTKSDASQEVEDRSMPPPAKVKSLSNTPDKTLDTDVNSVLDFIKKLPTIQPISSISDSDDNVGTITSGTDRPKKKRRKNRLKPDIDGGNSSSDDSSRFSESRRRSSLDEKKPGRARPKSSNSTHQPPVTNPYDATNTGSDTNNSTNGTKKTHKSPRKEPQSRKTTTNNRRRSTSLKKSRETIPSTDGSSDDNAPPKPQQVKKELPVKKPSKKKPKSPVKIASPIVSTSDSEAEQRPKHSQYQSPVPPRISSSSSPSDSDASSRSSTEVKGGKKIGKIVSDKNKNNVLRNLFNATKVGEGGKGGKGGAKGKGQVVVITPEDAQNQSKSNDSNASSNGALSVQNPKYLSPSSAFNTAAPSVMVRIDLARIDLTRLQIPADKLKNAVIRTKSPAVPIDQSQRKSTKRRRSSNHDEQDRWRHHPSSKKNFDQLSVSSSSSASSSNASDHQIENPAQRNASYTTNYTSDQLNNNIDHKSKDSFYHSPSSVDTKLPKIKRESMYQKQSFLKVPVNNFKNRIKQEPKDEIDVTQDMRQRSSSMTNNSFKDKKRKMRPDGGNDNSLPLPSTNHDRMPFNGLANGDLMDAKQEIVKKIYVSYFERTSDEIEQAETR